MKLIQISDLHFVPPGIRLLGLDPRARLEAAIADINAHHGDAELCILSGDLVDVATPEAYGALRETLAGLSVPYRAMIGNHDDRAVFRQAFPETPTDKNGFVQSVVSTPAGDLVLLDTHEPGTAGGAYCARRQAWLRARLAEAAGRPVYLFMHHPPFHIGIPSLDRIALDDPPAFAAALDGAAVAHIFFGHAHRPLAGGWRGIPFSGVRATVHQVPLDMKTVEPTPYSFEPPGYAVALIADGHTVVHHHDFLDRSVARPGMPRYTEVG